MKLRVVFAKLALGLGALLLVLLLVEGGLRALQALGLARRLGADDFFYRPPFAARMIPSADLELEVEHDPSDPNLNSHGFRDHEYSWEKPPGSFRIVALGDSVTYGLGVVLDDTWTKLLEARLNRGGARRYEILNLGVSGYGTSQEVRLLETRGLRYDPDLVLVVYVWNDVLPVKAMFEAINIALQQQRRYERYQNWASHSQLATATLIWARRRQYGRLDLRRAYENPEAWSRVTAAFARLGEVAAERGIPVVVVIFPMLIDFDDYPYADLDALVSEAAGKAGLSVLDLLDAFDGVQAEAVRLVPSDNSHPNALGHRIAAERIHAYLSERGLLE